MIRPVVGSALAAAALSLLAVHAAASDAKPVKATKAKAVATKSEPAAMAEDNAPVSPAQLAIADRVMTGEAKCEFNQQVSVQPVAGKPGHFKLVYKNAAYNMVPEETTTGAVRLEDKQAGMVWVQIPAKSMLLNAKAGQRMVDGCQQAQQRT